MILLLAVLLVWDAPPAAPSGLRVNDPVRYECEAWWLHVERDPRYPLRKVTIREQRRFPTWPRCTVGAMGRATTANIDEPPAGTAFLFCVRSIDAEGHRSGCVAGGGAP